MLWDKAPEFALENGTVVACGCLMEAALPLLHPLDFLFVDRRRRSIDSR